MSSSLRFFAAAAVLASLAVVLSAQPATPSSKPGVTSLVVADGKGGLTYRPFTAKGDFIPDFSHCGFGGGGIPLPTVPVKETLSPQADGNDSERIQAALDRVAALPPGPDGLRGAVLLKRGTYRCGETLNIRAGGVVLRGEGDEPEGTVITATMRRQQPLVLIGGEGAVREIEDSRIEISDAYVGVGARTFQVEKSGQFKVGDTVWVIRRGNAEWISAIGMDRIAPRQSAPDSTRQWEPFDLRFDRVVTAVDGERVTVDAPIVCAIDRRWGGGAIVKTSDQRIEKSGVEALRAVSVFDRTKTAKVRGEDVFVDESHASYLVQFAAVKNGWARRITTEFFWHGPAIINGGAKWITVEDARSLSPVSVITGGRRYPYHMNGGQLSLFQRCYSDRARHAFVFGSRVPGPNVFLHCTSENDYGTSEPHHRWSVGGLYDNVDARIAIQDRQHMGSGHGWSGANYVVWNSRGELVCQQPPTAQNFAIGFVGKRGRDAFERDAGWWESEGTPVQPRSLYEAQLKARLGK